MPMIFDNLVPEGIDPLGYGTGGPAADPLGYGTGGPAPEPLGYGTGGPAPEPLAYGTGGPAPEPLEYIFYGTGGPAPEPLEYTTKPAYGSGAMPPPSNFNTMTTSDAAQQNQDDSVVGEAAGNESSLSSWVGPYVADMLGRGKALADMPYEAYFGPLTAGESDLQKRAFAGLAGLAMPENMGAYDPGSFTDTGVQSDYMNPYIQGVLDPQLAELRRQAELSRVEQAGRLTRAGAFGGSRQQLADSELTRNLLDKTTQATGQAYADAFERGRDQFNIEQDRGMSAQEMANNYGLRVLADQLAAGSPQRDIEQEGIFADRAQFEEERDFPYKQVQYMQSLLQDLPLTAQSYSYIQPSSYTDIAGGAGGLMELLESLFGRGD